MLQIKNIKLYLPDGDPFGQINCSAPPPLNFVAYKIPRDKIKFLEEQTGGLYFFFQAQSVHIGKPENIEAANWNEALIFPAKDNSLGATEIRFLENKFCSLAKAANRYEITGSKNFPTPNISEEKESELEFFVEFVSVVAGVLGYRIFEPASETPVPPAEIPADDDDLFYLSRKLKTGIEIKAQCRRIGSNFIVMTGSQISQKAAKYIPEKIRKARKKAKISAENVLLEDVVFDNPSGASTFVLGMSSNGWAEWKTKDGVPLSNFR